MEYRQKPVIIEAIKWNGSQKSFDEIKELCPQIVDGGAVWYPDAPKDAEVKTDSWPLFIPTQGNRSASIGDYIVRGVKGEFYSCSPEIFEATYEPC